MLVQIFSLFIVCAYRKLIPVDALTCENVLYWRAACEFVKAKGDDGEELLEKLLPEPAIFAEYLYRSILSFLTDYCSHLNTGTCTHTHTHTLHWCMVALSV